MLSMLDMSKGDIEVAKELMWRHGMTRREAICWVVYNNGMSVKTISEREGVSEPLIFQRINAAKRKLTKIKRDGEL